MLIIKNENNDFYDVDGTLVIHTNPQDIPRGDAIQVYDAVTRRFVIVQINRPMVRLLRESKARGSYIIVWSRGGHRWAADVIKALDLVDYVDQVMSKPVVYFDDTLISDWLPYRVFLKPDTFYKQLHTNKENN